MDAPKAESLLQSAEDVSPGLTGGDTKPLVDQLEAQHPDLLAAVSWFLEHDRIDDARRLAISLATFWRIAGRMDEGSKTLDAVLAPAGGSRQHLGSALYQTGYLAFWMADDERSTRHYDRAIAVAQETDDVPLLAKALVGLARIALRSKDTDEARRLCREAIAEAEARGDPNAAAGALHVLGVAAQMAGDFDEARDAMTRRIAMGRETGNLAMVSSELGNLSMVERQVGNLDGAEAMAQEALEIDVGRGDEWSVPHKLNGIAAAAADRGEHERAATLLGAADAMVEAQRAPWPPDELAQYERTIGLLREAMDPATFEGSRTMGRAMSLDEAVAVGLGRPTL